MSDITQDESRDEFLSKIRRMNAETEKFVAEQRKLIAEESKLRAKVDKFRFDKFALAVGAAVGFMTAGAALTGLIIKAFGH